MNSSTSTTYTYCQQIQRSSKKRREASLPEKKTWSSQWEEQNKWRRRMDLSWRQSKQISLYPPIWERVSCYVSLQSRSICPSTPSHRHVSPSSPQTESSHQQSSWLIPSLLPITPLAPQTGARANTTPGPAFKQLSLWLYATPTNAASVKSNILVHLQLKNYSSFRIHRKIQWR